MIFSQIAVVILVTPKQELLFVHSFMQFELKCVCDVIYRSFFVHSREIFGHTWLTWLSKMTSSLWNWLLFSLIQRDKVKWVYLTLNEGYLRAANGGSKNLYKF